MKTQPLHYAMEKQHCIIRETTDTLLIRLHKQHFISWNVES